MGVGAGIIILLITVSLFTDIRYRKIPNPVILTGIIAGLVYCIYCHGAAGILYSAAGLVCGILLLLLPFAAGGIGAGDVKLLGAIGAVEGAGFVFHVFLSSAVWGGIISVILLVYHKKLLNIIKWLTNLVKQLFWVVATGGKHPVQIGMPPKTGIALPYAVPIFIGTLTIFALEVIPW